jgi:hypothetical protein
VVARQMAKAHAKERILWHGDLDVGLFDAK